MDTSIVTLDEQGNYVINGDNDAVLDLYLTVTNTTLYNKEEYDNMVHHASKLLSMIDRKHGVVDADVMIFAWGVCTMGKIEEERIISFFKSKLHNKIILSNDCFRFVEEYLSYYTARVSGGIDVNSVIYNLDKMVTRCKQDSELFRKEIIKNQDAMFVNFQGTIAQLVGDAKETIKKLGVMILDYGKKLRETRMELWNAQKELQVMKSKENEKRIGEEYLLNLFKEYLKNEKKWSQHRRDAEYEWLKHLLMLEGMPQDVKKLIEALAEDKEEKKVSVTVKAEAGATVNNYDIHGNNQVNTNKKD